MNVGKKLMIAFGALTALLVGFGVYSTSTIGRMSDMQKDLANRQSKKLIAVGKLNYLAEKLGSEEGHMMVGAMTNDPAEAKVSAEDVLKAEASLEKALADLTADLQTEQGRKLAAKMGEDLKKWVPVHAEIARLSLDGKYQEAERMRVDQGEPLLDAMDKDTDQLQASVESVLADTTKKGESATTWSRWITFAMMGLSFAVGASAFFVVRQITVQLRQITLELGAGAEQVASAASQVSSSSQSLAQGASEQAASLEETSASSEEINSMARKNTDSSTSAAQLVGSSQLKFEETNQSLEETVAAMGEISAHSGKISKIIKTIDEIAFQTNILALNAAVEAARAGEAGMGFAVVADEVRNLAQRCAQAARDTAVLIEESIAKSNDGTAKVDRVAASIHSVIQESAQIKALVNDVNMGSQEQARGIEQVARALTEMEAVTQRTAANAEESASAAQELTAQSQGLNSIVDRLMAMVGGD